MHCVLTSLELAHRCVCTLCVECRSAHVLVQLTSHLQTHACTVRCMIDSVGAVALAEQSALRFALPSLSCCSLICSSIVLNLAHRLALTPIINPHATDAVEMLRASSIAPAQGGW